MIKNRTKNTARNIIFGMLNQILALILNFINRTIFIKILGPGYLGINGLFSDILMMLSMADLGFGIAMVYSFYKPLAENNQDKISALILFYKKIYNVIALAVTVLGLTILPFLDYLIKLNKPIPYIKIYYLLFLGNTVISYLFVYKTSIINADQKNYIISKYQMLINIFRVLFQSIFLLMTKNYFIYLIIQVISTFINNIIASKKADELYPFIKKFNIKLNKKEKHNIYENMKSVFIYKFSSVLLNGTDNTLISTIIGTIWVGYYSNYTLIINTLNNFINIIYSSATASIGNIIVSEKPEKRFEVFQSMQTISLIISTFATVCLYTMLNNFIYLWLGTKYILNDTILAAIILNFYLGNVLQPIWSYREATGLYIKTKYIMLIAAIENIILSILMGKIIGMAGILFASAISRITTNIWYEPKLLFDEYFNKPVKRYFMPVVLNAIITILIIIIINEVAKCIIIDTFFKFIIKTTFVILFTIVILFIFYYRSAGFKLSLEKLRLLFK